MPVRGFETIWPFHQAFCDKIPGDFTRKDGGQTLWGQGSEELPIRSNSIHSYSQNRKATWATWFHVARYNSPLFALRNSPEGKGKILGRLAGWRLVVGRWLVGRLVGWSVVGGWLVGWLVSWWLARAAGLVVGGWFRKKFQVWSVGEKSGKKSPVSKLF